MPTYRPSESCKSANGERLDACPRSSLTEYGAPEADIVLGHSSTELSCARELPSDAVDLRRLKSGQIGRFPMAVVVAGSSPKRRASRKTEAATRMNMELSIAEDIPLAAILGSSRYGTAPRG